MSKDLRSGFKCFKKLVKDREVVVCRADKDGKRLALYFKGYNLIMERKLANQFPKLIHIDLTIVGLHNGLKHVENKCNNISKHCLELIY